MCKNPISETFDTILNLISTGQFQKEKQKLNYDNMFHLFLVLELKNGLLIRLEKNQVLNIGIISKDFKKKSCLKVPMVKNLTINNLLNNALKNIGKSFFLYNAENNNCQIFIDNLLTYSNLNNNTLKNYVLQNTKKLINNLPSITKDLINGATDLAGFFDILLYGRGYF